MSRRGSLQNLQNEVCTILLVKFEATSLTSIISAQKDYEEDRSVLVCPVHYDAFANLACIVKLA